MANDYSFDIIKHLGDLTDVKSGYQIQVNIVSYNGARPKIDIRRWNVEEGKPYKGIALTEEEAYDLKNILTAFFKSKEGGNV